MRLTLRDPQEGELSLGFSGVRIGVDESGVRWVVRTGYDELLAYLLAKTFFGSVVPRTVVLEGSMTAQLLVEGRTAHSMGSELLQAVRTPDALKDLAHIVCMDLVLGNGDRHGNNWIVSQGRLVAVDNTRTRTPISLKEALRPAYRAVMVDDPDFTPVLMNCIETALAGFALYAGNPEFLQRAFDDLAQWRRDFFSTARGL